LIKKKRDLKINNILPVFIFGFLVISSCVTTKKSKDEVGFVGKKYHDMTAKFNGYFNANELYQDALVQLETSHQDNYNQILNVYPYAAVEDPTIVEADMDKAIEKVTKVSTLHEVSKWVDDCYVLMGKAQYMKGDYESSQETFEYFLDDFNPKDPDSRVYQSPDRKGDAKARKKEQERERKIKEEEREKVKKEREKERKEEQKKRKQDKKNREKNRGSRKKVEKKEEVPVTVPAPITGVASTGDEISLSADEEYLRKIREESNKKEEVDNPHAGGFLKHRPAYYEGMLWLSKSYIKREKWLDAKYYLDRIEEEGQASEEVLSEVPVVRADMLLQMKEYNEALVTINQAIESTKDKKSKARLAYISAQLYQMKGDAASASAAFELVGKYKASYEMQLNAELSQIKNTWAAGSVGSEATMKKLKKLLKEGKNEPYQGAIYFTMAEIMLTDGNEAEALEYFNLALSSSAGANKTEIYYRLATLFLGKEQYLDAKNYFDSTLTIMNKKDERYLTAKRYSSNLTDIARNIAIIELQDSMLMLSNMSPEELKEFALKQIKADIEKEEANTKEEPGLVSAQTVLSGNSRFFAYNPTAIQKGRQDFNKRWGVRSLEDDWRRSNKAGGFANETVEEVKEEVVERDFSKEIDKIVRNVPTTEEKKLAVNESLENALFELGTGFRTYIENYLKSNETLEDLLTRYPDTKHKVEAYYYLYLNHLDLNNQSEADYYFNKITKEHPNSPFAIYLLNPDDEDALMTEEKKISLYYENTYSEFEKGKYQVVFDRIEQARKDFGQDHKMAAKYDLLRAMAIGNLEGQNEYVNALRGVILKYNNTPEQTHAKEMLRFLRGDEEAFGEEVTEEDLGEFKLEDDKLHYIILLLYDTDGNGVNEAKVNINKYNEKNFADWRLRSTSMYLNQENKTHLILLRRFQDRAQAMEYYNKYAEQPNAFLDGESFSYDLFAINQLNYREVITQKSVKSYRKFFETQYLGK